MFVRGKQAFSAPTERAFVRQLASVKSVATQEKLRSWQDHPWKPLSKTASFRSTETEGAERIVPTRIDEAVVVVDPFSSGALLAEKVVESGRYCVRVFSEYNSPVANLVAESATCQFDATVQHDSRIQNIDEAADNTGESVVFPSNLLLSFGALWID